MRFRSLAAGAVAFLALPFAPAARAEAPAEAPDLPPAGTTVAEARVADLLTQAKQAADASNHAAADSLATAALAMLEADASPDTLALAEAHLRIAQSLHGRRKFADSRALDSATRALELYEASTPGNDPRRADAHHVLAGVLKELNRSPDALPHAEQALAIRRAAFGEDHEEVAAALYNLGTVHKRLGRTDDALAALGQGLAIRLRLDRPGDKWIGHSRVEIAELLDQQGRYTEARAEFETALHDYEARLGPADGALATGLQRFAGFEMRSGNTSRAVDLCQRAIEVAEASPNYNPVNLALLRANLAPPLIEVGDLARARQLVEQTLPVFLENLGPKHRNTTWARNSLAFLQAEMGDTAGALSTVRSVRETIEADSTIGDTTVLSQALLTEARLIAETDLDQAIRLAERAVATESARPTPAPHFIVTPLALLMELQARKGDAPAVAETGQRLQQAFDAGNLAGSKFEVLATGQRGLAAWRLGRLDEAVRLTREASLVARVHLIQNVRSLPDRQGLLHASIRSIPMTTLLEIATGPGTAYAADVLDELIRWRGLVAEEIGRRRPPRGDAASGVAEVHAEWVAAQRALAEAEVRLSTAGRDSASVARADSLRRKADDAERAWAAVAPLDAGGVAPERVGLREVRAALQGDEALVSVALAPRRGKEPRVLAWVVRGGSAPATDVRLLDLGTQPEIAERVTPWLALCGASPRGDANREEQCRQAGTEVRKRVWDPLADALGGARQVFMVLEGPLHSIPWGALPDGEGYLAERDVRICILEAERDLLDRDDREKPGVGLLAVGGVDFDGPTGAPGEAPLQVASSRAVLGECAARVEELLPLPGTDEEIRSIERVWEETTGSREESSLPAEPVDVLRGLEASEAALKLLAPGHRVLHLATHGIVLGDCAVEGEGGEGQRGVGGIAPVGASSPPGSVGNTAKAKAGKADSGDAKAAAANGANGEALDADDENLPWLGRRVYLGLAGANHASERDRDDNEGFLTAEEVATLDLRGIEWVVLSACQSGVGRSWEREGLLGMRRAFRMAGARALIASQWSVDDVATLEWMTALYRARATESSTAGALQQACREVLATRRAQRRSTHPFYWAAFGATGR